MIIRVAFYKGKGNFINSIVRWWTGSNYSHAELILPDNITWIGISPFFKSKINRRIRLNIDFTEWDFVDLKITEEQYSIIMDFFHDTEGEGYDWIGMLFSQFLPCKIKHRKRWYCSEWIAYALRISCVVDWRSVRLYDRKDLSPAALYKLIHLSKIHESKKI